MVKGKVSLIGVILASLLATSVIAHAESVRDMIEEKSKSVEKIRSEKIRLEKARKILTEHLSDLRIQAKEELLVYGAITSDTEEKISLAKNRIQEIAQAVNAKQSKIDMLYEEIKRLQTSKEYKAEIEKSNSKRLAENKLKKELLIQSEFKQLKPAEQEFVKKCKSSEEFRKRNPMCTTTYSRFVK